MGDDTVVNGRDRASAKTGGNLVQSVDRAISVLELLAKNGESGITEIAAELGVHKSTASRLLTVLEQRGLVEQLGQRGKYVIGFGIVRLAGAATGRMDLAQLAQTVCQSLAEQLGETVNVAVPDSGVAINISQVRGAASVTTHNWVGQRTPLHATSSGKVLLAHLPDRQREELLSEELESYTPRTVTDIADLRAELDQVLRDGYTACFEELELGLNALAAPVRGPDGGVLAAISASGPSYRLSRRRIRQVAPQLIAAAGELSQRLGYLGD
ncbi:DNA-binding IclR family transcriptional regulator [Actinoalloteichus hoggarensis]|uniref:Glycerol operon regulatory protein n=1 Tax=Actinoalloteichus hoggarensis TaxID=1470176 RepID=A0A221VZH9_9PSEU|nr:Acetate operon repressor [Actinoalloteichus hoggarensis]MBB5920149.1 DNA-binding IclR family transcriptional regulator [Actinoalloteichus hoggarensis]